MTYACFVLFQRCASHRTMHMSYRSTTYTWNDVILVKRSMIRVFYRVTFKLLGHVVRMRPIKFQLSYRELHVTRHAHNGIAELEKYPEASKTDYSSIIISRMTRDRTRTMVLRNSRSIHKHRTGCELSYCDMREARCAFA